jgi:hypothetical protein
MVLIYEPPNADFVDFATQRSGREKYLLQLYTLPLQMDIESFCFKILING